jgi:hypothetical protein
MTLSTIETRVLREALRAWHMGYEIEFLTDEQIATANALARRGWLEALPDAAYRITGSGRDALERSGR